jgi:glycosyltransferase involved in cell wall biosynthesis
MNASSRSSSHRRILFVGGTTGGGVATINVEVIRIFRAAGFECRLVDTEKMKRGRPAAVAYLLAYGLTLLRIVTFRPRVVYLQIAQTGYLHQSLFLLFAKLCGRKTVAHFHAKADLAGSTTPGQLRAILRSARYIDEMILLTDPCRDSLVNAGWKGPTHVIPNFIATDGLPSSLPPASERRDLLYLGRMDWEKGIFEIVEMARRMPEEKFVFVGNFADPGQESRFRGELEGVPNAEWLGAVYGDGKYGIIARSRLLIFPTRRDEFPMTLIESTILGCVPLVSPVGSVGEIVQDGFNGRYVDPDDLEGIMRRIRELKDDTLFTGLSRNGIDRARSRFTSDAVRDRILEIVG